MKKILILTSNSGKTVSWKEREQYVAEFAKKTEKNLKNTSVHYAVYGDMYFSVLAGRTQVYDSRNGLDLREYDFVHFKNWQYELEDAAVIASYLHQQGVQFANEEVNSGLHFNKLSQMFTLSFEGVPVPDTIYGYPVNDRFKQFLLERIEFPMIVKANDGSRGNSNYLVKDMAQLDKILKNEPEKHFIFQNFIPNEGDYRVLFVGSHESPLVFLRQASGESHLNNTSQGGSGTLVEYRKLSPEIRRDARAATRALRREISGVDVIINSETGEYFILEVNSTPALATGFSVDEKLHAFCTYIEKLVGERGA